MNKKVIAILLIIALSFTLFSCDHNVKEPDETEGYVLPTEIISADISLPYTSSDSFDPYVSQSSMNRDLIPVIYESLYVPEKDGKGRGVLAAESTVTDNSVTVKIVSGVKFSDGVELNASYVKVAFEKAKNNVYYKTSLSNISSVTVVNNLTVKFNISGKEPFSLNVLNFPIIRVSGGKTIGSGKYMVQYLDDTMYLQVNTLHRNYTESWNKQIALYDMAGMTGPVYPFKANEISVYKNELNGDEYVNLSSKTISQDTNNLVYLGVNSKWAGSLTSVQWVRQVINIGINRTVVGASSFLGQSEPVVTPYRTTYYQLNSENLPAFSGETQKAISILERNGYNSFNSDGIRTNGANLLKISILVCTENQYKLKVAQAVKSSLEDLGFGVTIIEKKTFEEFKLALDDGFYGLYIGETNMPYNYEMDEFFSSDGSLSYGINQSFFAEYENLKNGTDTTMLFIESFETEVPFIPLFYKKSVISINPNVTGVDENNVYASVCDWKLQK